LRESLPDLTAVTPPGRCLAEPGCPAADSLAALVKMDAKLRVCVAPED
jgi:hypothetical protein